MSDLGEHLVVIDSQPDSLARGEWLGHFNTEAEPGDINDASFESVFLVANHLYDRR